MSENKRFTLSIGHTTYTIVSDEDENTVYQAYELVQQMMTHAQSYQTRAQETAAVLTALKLAQRVQSLEQYISAWDHHVSHLTEQIDEYLSSQP